MSKARVQNMTNSRGNVAPNQFEIFTDEGVTFQSYDSVIVFKPYGGKVQIDEGKWDYSRTTGKFRNLFLRETKSDTERKLKTGEYVFADLNAA